jgi:hypothetical protein
MFYRITNVIRLKKPGSQYSFRISQDIKPIKTKTSGEKKRNVTAFVSDNEEELPTPSQGGLVIENGGEKKRNVIAFVSGDEEGLPTPSQGGFVIENGEEKKSNATVFISDDEEGLSTPSQGGFVIENGGAKLASRFKAVKPPVVTEGLDQLNLSDGSKPSQVST